MAVKIAVAMGADVFVISHSENKKEDAKRFGAKGYINSTISDQMQNEMNSFDFIINTVSANLDLTNFLFLLKRDGTMVQVGAPDKPNTLNMFSMIIKRRRLAGSLIGGIKETQEMLDFCGKHNITADIEVISADKINEAYERVVKSDVKYRFVIDLKSF
ncbi:zinc-binding dehydrogenase [Pigmentibacter sp. JX0631]|nr:zinc-binding dehydrogenase [Pigmentibacter sp. JX0631]WGL60097.1 zinc-binding dehydrogenase [Pigmentibacter sp. JX0631]